MEKEYPKHIALILDGNRRWAKKQGLPVWAGHKHGKETGEKLFDWIIDLDIKEVTLFIFSTENFKRPSIEVKFLINIFTKSFANLLNDSKIHKNKVKINFIGRLHLLPKKLQDVIKNVKEATKDYKNHTANFALAYGGRAEVTDAVKKIAEDVKKGKIKPEEISENTITENLYLKSSPDIIIRTGGAMRTSNFLIWQQAYSEWFFVDKFWPDFTKEDLEGVIDTYINRERRYGK